MSKVWNDMHGKAMCWLPVPGLFVILGYHIWMFIWYTGRSLITMRRERIWRKKSGCSAFFAGRIYDDLAADGASG